MVMATALLVTGPPPVQLATPLSVTTWQESAVLVSVLYPPTKNVTGTQFPPCNPVMTQDKLGKVVLVGLIVTELAPTVSIHWL